MRSTIRYPIFLLLLTVLFSTTGCSYDKTRLIWYRKADAHAQFHLSSMYQNEEAVAQNKLGEKYASGTGVARNYVKAVDLYRKAAEQGYAIAQFNLGEMYEKGKGVSQSDEQA